MYQLFLENRSAELCQEEFQHCCNAAHYLKLQDNHSIRPLRHILQHASFICSAIPRWLEKRAKGQKMFNTK